MFKITRENLQTKTDAQLKELFNQAQRELTRTKRLTRAFNAAQVTIVIIRQELQSRAPRL